MGTICYRIVKMQVLWFYVRKWIDRQSFSVWYAFKYFTCVYFSISNNVIIFLQPAFSCGWNIKRIRMNIKPYLWTKYKNHFYRLRLRLQLQLQLRLTYIYKSISSSYFIKRRNILNEPCSSCLYPNRIAVTIPALEILIICILWPQHKFVRKILFFFTRFVV